MSKNIVFCADGTWNGPGEDQNNQADVESTNVFKLFCNLAGTPTPNSTRLKDEQESALLTDGQVLQVAKYIHGVGDSGNFLVKVLGGTLGAGIISRIVRGYTFVSRNYIPGDKIFLVGFSRGAYTARALAGFVAAKGLLDARKLDLSDKESAYRLGAAVWNDYRKSAMRNNDNWLGWLEEIALDLPAFLTQPPTDKLIPVDHLEAVAVWDTVGALGIPEYILGSDRRVESMRFVDQQLNAKVTNGFHAISVDEQRSDFTPTLWDPRSNNSVVQRLFPGAHADVGGGYPDRNRESGLSDGALYWMIGNLSSLSVLFSNPPICPVNPDSCGTAHQPWLNPPWNMLVRGLRQFPNWLQTACDPSVDERRHGGGVVANPGLPPSIYNPANLP